MCECSPNRGEKPRKVRFERQKSPFDVGFSFLL